MKMIKQLPALIPISLAIGVIVGCVDTFFGKGLLLVSSYRQTYFFYLIPFLPLVGFFIVFMYQRFGEAVSKGMGLILSVGQGEEKEVPLILVPLVIVSTWLTHLFGGSAGREGVAVQIGGALSYQFSRFSLFKSQGDVLILIGMAAGFSGLFQTPLAAIAFPLEVLAVRRWSISFLFPMALAAFTASLTSHSLGLEKFTYSLTVAVPLGIKVLLILVLLGGLFGLVGNGFALGLRQCRDYLARRLVKPYYRMLVVGCCLSIGFYLAHQGRYSGLGTNLITMSFSGDDRLAYDWLLKAIFTILTLSIGFQGGEVTPLFAIGASLGAILAPLCHLPVDFVAALGYVAVFSSATNTLLAPMLIGGEVFGWTNLPYFIPVLMVSYALDRRSSIYHH